MIVIHLLHITLCSSKYLLRVCNITYSTRLVIFFYYLLFCFILIQLHLMLVWPTLSMIEALSQPFLQYLLLKFYTKIDAIKRKFASKNASNFALEPIIWLSFCFKNQILSLVFHKTILKAIKNMALLLRN